MEVPSEGGTQTAASPTEINTLQDALAAAGYFVDGPSVTVADKTTLIDRTAAGMRFTDQATSRVLAELVTSVQGGVNYHGGLRDISHFLAGEGPGDGFASGAFLQRNFAGQLLVSEIWYTSSAATTKLFSRTLSYATGSIVPSTVVFAMYNAAGQVQRTVTDTYTYNGIQCISINRTWS